jgi:hypothetical protein
MMNLNEDNGADHYGANPDCHCGDLAPGRTEAYFFVLQAIGAAGWTDPHATNKRSRGNCNHLLRPSPSGGGP